MTARWHLPSPPETLRQVKPDRRIVEWPCPGGCKTNYAVYEGEEPRRWHRRPDGVLICGGCWRRWKRAEELKAGK
jgi:hypothetical protein